MTALARDLEAHVRVGVDQVLPAEALLLLGVSGGSDSVGLLGALAPWCAGRLSVAYVDHGLRAAADDDARLVERLAARFALPFRRLQAHPTSRAPGRSETAARARRLAALSAEACRGGQAAVLLAHHLDDACETVLLHLTRGHRGLRALAGVPTLRPMAPGVLLLRPLLHGPAPPGRDALASFRRAAGLPCAEDETNADLAIPRNALRALLARRRAPLNRDTLARVRWSARWRLEAMVGRAARLLERDLVGCGHGSLLRRSAWEALRHEPGLAAEALRLLGASLAAPRRLTIRASLLDRWRTQSRGSLLMPATPRPLRAELGNEGLGFPDEPLAPGEPAARTLAALAATPLHL